MGGGHAEPWGIAEPTCCCCCFSSASQVSLRASRLQGSSAAWRRLVPGTPAPASWSQSFQFFPHSLGRGQSEGRPSGRGKPSPLPPMKHWVVSHFPLEQFHSPVKPAVKARWDGDPGPGKEEGKGINTPSLAPCPHQQQMRNNQEELKGESDSQTLALAPPQTH